MTRTYHTQNGTAYEWVNPFHCRVLRRPADTERQVQSAKRELRRTTTTGTRVTVVKRDER